MWDSFDKAFARMEDVFRRGERAASAMEDIRREMERIERDSQWATITRTWTTNTTAPDVAPPTYSDGFDDGWNAHDAANKK